MGDRKFVIALVVLLVIYVVYEMNKPQPEDWTVTYDHKSTEPFGAKALEELMTPIFSEGISHQFKSVYELIEEDSLSENTLMVANSIALGRDDTDLLLEQVAAGRTIFLSAFGFGGVIADTFGLEATFQEFLGIMPAEEIEKALSGEATKQIFYEIDGEQKMVDFPVIGATNSFEPLSSDSLEVLAYNDEDRPVLVRYRNNGQLVFSTIPLSFTNYFTLLEETTAFTEAQLLLIPQDEPLIRDQYYHVGRLESTSPLRVLLSNPSLRWATFLLLFGILLFFLLQSKRKQRIIPVIQPLSNLTLEFVRTLGRLYYRQRDHVNLCKKRVLYWKEFIRSRYNLNTQYLNYDFIEELSYKSGRDEGLIAELVKSVNHIESGQQLSGELLLNFEKKLNEFYGIK